jgi:dipeptidase D
MTTLDTLEPKPLWHHFHNLTTIPRPSKKETAACNYLKALAAERGLVCEQDKVGNILIRVPATPGLEGTPSVVIQNHIDMVCEKDQGTSFNFDTDPIPVYIDGDWIRARGTTLGADNGLGAAAALALIDDKSCQHGPLELLFTIDEETGLTGATHLDGSLIKSKIMLNLDSEEEGIFYIGCAGGVQCTINAPCRREAAGTDKTVALSIAIRGLRGGHSGLNIVDNRGNALKILALCLRKANQNSDIRIVELQGGSKHNAIPRESFASIVVPADRAADLRARFESEFKRILREFGAAEPGLTMEWKEGAPSPSQGISDEASTQRIINLLCALPHGVSSMNRDLVGLVETSSNLAIISTEESRFKIIASVRSSVEEAKTALLEQYSSVCTLAGVTLQAEGSYPAWRPNPNSPLLKRAQALWKEHQGTDTHATAIHAGLECGIILEKCPGMDVISFGPDIRGAHSPTECASIPSAGRFYAFLKQLLTNLAKSPL